MKKIVVVGGGTGAFVVLSGLKQYPVSLSVIVSMMDSGGSTGRLRDQLGVLPPGDLRQCLVALSEAPDLWRKLFLYRFASGDLAGHNFGNIFITALEKNTEDYQHVVDTAAFILKTKGHVIPVTFDKAHLCVQYEDGEVIETEAAIDTAIHKPQKIKRAYLAPAAHPNKKALEAIAESDYIILGPGDLYTSLIPNFLVDGMTDAVRRSPAKIVMIMNLMTKKGQTTNYTASDHIADLEHYLTRPVDSVIINSKNIPHDIVAYYAQSDEREVINNVKEGAEQKHIYCEDIISDTQHKQAQYDKALRSLLRHDSDKLARVLWKIVQ